MSSNQETGMSQRLTSLARGLTTGQLFPPKQPTKRLVDPWLVVIDPQVVFADPESRWHVPGFDVTMGAITELAPRFGERVIVTRWLPGRKVGSWKAYFKRWEFADRPPSDPMFDLVPAAVQLSNLASVDVPTFSKWGPTMRSLIGPTPHLVLTGYSTDCCVLSTALAAADAGAAVKVIADACMSSTQTGHEAALNLMDQFSPQIKVITSDRL